MTIASRKRSSLQHGRRDLEKLLASTNNPRPPVYAPREDSLLMLEAISNLPLEEKRILDVGTGSGILALFCAMRGGKVTASDVEETAVKEAQRAANRLGVRLTLVVSDLFAKIPGRFDLVLFNPPYLPSKESEDRAVDGGPGGTLLAEMFLDDLPPHLESDAQAFVLLSSLNDPDAVQRRHGNFEFSIVAKRAFFFEELRVLRVRLRDDLAV
jgi:release factor glutamine methyltransferase